MIAANTFLSIITVVHNDLVGLRRTYQSLFTLPDNLYEWIVIDNVSVDGSAAFLNSLSSISLKWTSEPDSGIYEAMNKGASKALGKLLLFLNAGDEVSSTGIEYLVHKRDQLYDNRSIYVFDCAEVSLDNNVSIFSPCPRQLIYYMSISHPAVLIPAPLFRRLSGYSQAYRLASDYDFFLRAYLLNINFLSIPVIFSLFHRGGLSDQRQVLCTLETIQILWRNYSPGRLRGTYYILKSLLSELINRYRPALPF